MVDCKACEFENICTMPDFVRNDLRLCKTYQQKKPHTNADRIRAMSDEELAEMFVEKCNVGYEFAICWLKSEVKQ